MAKRTFDFFFSLSALIFLSVPMLFIWIAAALDTKSDGIFIQERVGQFGKIFRIYKFRTMSDKTSGSKAIAKTGVFLRNFKLDELPQLFNVLKGQMSIVGPRPDIIGYYDKLEGESRKILELKPGLTSAASIKYYNEETLLSQHENPLQYNDEVIFPDKIKMNLEYCYNRSFFGDITIILNTIFRKKQQQ